MKELKTIEPISDKHWFADVSETVAAFMDDADARVDREDFVHNLGVLLSQTREGIIKCELVEDDVVVTYKGGATTTINTRYDSYMAIIRDVLKYV